MRLFFFVVESYVKVLVKLLREGARVPQKMTPNSAGYDVFALLESPVMIASGERALIPTGVAIALPGGMEAQIRPRSGLAIRYGIGLLNSPGTIDPDYRGEIKVILINFGKEPFIVKSGDRIAQMVFARVEQVELTTSDSIDETVRGDGGFGHTGV